MDKVRIGVIGLGNMGAHHAQYIDSLQNATLAAVCDMDPARVEKAAAGKSIGRFNTYQDLLASGTVDAVLVATPHFQHGEIARAAFDRNIHVLVEKPVAVTVGDARRTNEAAARVPHLKYGIMYQSRTQALWRRMREMVQKGDIGPLTRVTWIATDWFRTWAYYGSGGWRATWKGEGGGVLLNQCPHNLDLLQWVTGLMPRRITAVGFLGKTHPIEVEDEVSAIMEYDNGAIGHFIATTGEAPGTNRFEICGDGGKVIAEGGKLTLSQTRQDVREVREKSTEAFATIETTTADVPTRSDRPEGHQVITQNFVNAILRNEPLIAPGEEGVRGLEIGNAMLMAGVTRQAVDLPLDAAKYDALLAELAAKYGGRKTLEVKEVTADIVSSFKHRQ